MPSALLICHRLPRTIAKGETTIRTTNYILYSHTLLKGVLFTPRASLKKEMTDNDFWNLSIEECAEFGTSENHSIIRTVPLILGGERGDKLTEVPKRIQGFSFGFNTTIREIKKQVEEVRCGEPMEELVFQVDRFVELLLEPGRGFGKKSQENLLKIFHDDPGSEIIPFIRKVDGEGGTVFEQREINFARGYFRLEDIMKNTNCRTTLRPVKQT